MISTLRYYDEAVVNYFKNITVEDGDGSRRTPQILFSIPSRQSLKLQLSNSSTPLFPLLYVTRTGFSPANETNIVKGHVTRPHIFELNSSEHYFEGAEMLPYNLIYQLDYMTIVQEMHNQITEQLLFNLHKKHYIKVRIELSNIIIESNAYIDNINVNDSSSYDKVEDSVNRIFHGTIGFNLYAYLFDPKYATHSVLTGVINVKDNVTYKDLI